jgi:hypothetical protein
LLVSLRRIERRRVPTDRWFRTTAKLNSLFRAMSHYIDDRVELHPSINDVVNETSVPVWVRMEKYKAMETPSHPDGLIWGPVIKIGTFNSPDVAMFGYHNACGLFRDYTFDPNASDRDDGGWIYHPYEMAGFMAGEDVSVYECDKCGKHNYRDDFGQRFHNSACLMDGSLVCRDCEWTGMIMHEEVTDRARKCRELAKYVGAECARSLERGFEDFARRESGNGTPLQTRVWLDSKWSFTWSTRALVDGVWKPYIHGGLIMHGPTPTQQDDGTYLFETYDYGLKAVRSATTEEIDHIRWSTHT